MNTIKKTNIAIVVVLTMIMISCQKESTFFTLNQENIQLDSVVMTNHNEESDPVRQASMHMLPNAITQLSQNPDYGDYYYFDNLYHDCSLDTVGYCLYAAQSKLFPNHFLSMAANGDSLLMCYCFDFPIGFDWDYSYLHYQTVDVEAYLYDGTDFYRGTFNVRQGLLTVTWVNSSLFNAKQQLHPGWGTFCGYWTIGGYICAQLVGLACPPAGAVIGAISCVVTSVKCL